MNAGIPRRPQAAQNGSSIGLVDGQSRAVRLARRQAKALANFTHSNRTGFHVRFQLGHGLFRPSRTDSLKRDSRKHPHAIFVGTVANDVEGLGQARAGRIVGADEDTDADGVELGDERRQSLTRRDIATGVTVHIHCRILRLRNEMFGGYEGRLRAVVDNARHWKLRCLASPRSRHRHGRQGIPGPAGSERRRLVPAPAVSCPRLARAAPA